MAKRESLGQRIKRLRQAAGLTQEQLAVQSGVPVSSVRNWEQDHREPGLGPLYKVAKVLNVSMEELARCVVESDSPRKPHHRPK
jgi:transcriptional regulator with XRE-family HTH domain